ncbi:MAG: Fic family protein [Bacteroidota bacterium]
MSLEEQLQRLTEQRQELDALRPIPTDALQQLNEKLSLEWTFHSNKLEGNSLDFNETKLLLNRGLTAKGKPMKDHRDIEGHQSVVENLEALVKRDAVLTLAELRELHKLLLKESYLSVSETPDGEQVKRRIEIGQFKTQPNHVITRTGKVFRYTEPELVEAEMTALWDWLREQDALLKSDASDAPHPVEAATELHYRFVRIHPFDDGNGRLSRILMNYLLMRNGYYPSVIKADERNAYFDALGVADETGDLSPLTTLIASSVAGSMHWALKAAKGESLRELGDWRKELIIYDKLVSGLEDKANEKFLSHDYIIKSLSYIAVPMFSSLFEVTSEFQGSIEGLSIGHNFLYHTNNRKKTHLVLGQYYNIEEYEARYILDDFSKASSIQSELVEWRICFVVTLPKLKVKYSKKNKEAVWVCLALNLKEIQVFQPFIEDNSFEYSTEGHIIFANYQYNEEINSEALIALNDAFGERLLQVTKRLTKQAEDDLKD